MVSEIKTSRCSNVPCLWSCELLRQSRCLALETEGQDQRSWDSVPLGVGSCVISAFQKIHCVSGERITLCLRLYCRVLGGSVCFQEVYLPVCQGLSLSVCQGL